VYPRITETKRTRAEVVRRPLRCRPLHVHLTCKVYKPLFQEDLLRPELPAVIMRVITLVLGGTLALSTSYVIACPDGEHAHEVVRRAKPLVPLTPPSRPLVWGDVNIIHTTDSHGWLLGHQKESFPEPNYRCAFGLLWEYVSTGWILTMSTCLAGISVILRPLWRI
jgi:hypothetical protein